MKEYSLLQKAYDFSEFEETGKNLIEQLATYLRNQQLPENKATRWQAPKNELNYWQNYIFKDLNGFVDDLLSHSIHLHNPKFMGHQVSAPAPLSALMNLLSGLLNNGMAVYEMGQAATVIEKCVVDMFCETVGYDKNSNGIMTSGGTLANLTALLAARQALKDCDVWQQGCTEKLAVLVSAQAHYSIDRAARVMGMGHDGVVLVPVDEGFAMDIQKLADCYQQTIKAGFKVVAVVGSACSTATGVYDDLDAIGKFCEKLNIWFHVDGAHGGAAVFSPTHKKLLKGLDKADSIVIDTHKMMMTPALSTVVLYKDKIKGSQTFHQKAMYLFEDKDTEEQWFNSGLRTFECTKFLMSLKFYILWKNYGIDIFKENVDCLYELGTVFAKIIQRHPKFELALQPQTNIVCFRYLKEGASENELNQLNKTIRQTLLEDSEFYIVQAVLNETLYLRVTLMNPMTNEEHLQALLEKILSVEVYS